MLCRIVSLLAVSACIDPKCCVERSPFSFCQLELQSVVSDRLAGGSRIQSSFVYHCLLAIDESSFRFSPL